MRGRKSSVMLATMRHIEQCHDDGTLVSIQTIKSFGQYKSNQTAKNATLIRLRELESLGILEIRRIGNRLSTWFIRVKDIDALRRKISDSAYRPTDERGYRTRQQVILDDMKRAQPKTQAQADSLFFNLGRR